MPDQEDQQQEMNRSRLGQSAGMRLPWGNTRELVPSDVLSRSAPGALCNDGRHDRGIERQGELSHECIRYAPLSHLTNFIRFFNKLALFCVPLLLFLLSFAYWVVRSFSMYDKAWPTIQQELWEVAIVFLAVPSSIWLVSTLMLRLFPRWTVRAGRGPHWELNRRTGMVTIWNYPRKIPLRPRDEPTVTEAPFYEFDGWACGSMDRGGPFFYFVLSHRYQKLEAYFDEFISRCYGRPKEVYGLWDFIQNYMDITKPLPDIPMLEAYRHLDPVTARYDEENGRPERYWRDMDKKIFKKELKEMSRRVWDIDTEQRANLMAEKVRYAT